MSSIYDRSWIIENSVDITDGYEDGVLTIRGLHYQLVGRGMINDTKHYKKVVSAMITARWGDVIEFEKFSDLDRVMVGSTSFEDTNVEDELESVKNSFEFWMNNYFKNRWENQPYYPEIFIEKKALQGTFSSICSEWDVALGACKGYPSLTFLKSAYERFKNAEQNGKTPIIIYFGDYDPSGEDIPRSIQENMSRFGLDIEVRRKALMRDQVIELNLPPAPAKLTDSRTANWDGLGQVELDAVKPELLKSMCEYAIREVFDMDLYSSLLIAQEREKTEYKRQVKEFVLNTDS